MRIPALFVGSREGDKEGRDGGKGTHHSGRRRKLASKIFVNRDEGFPKPPSEDMYPDRQTLEIMLQCGCGWDNAGQTVGIN